MQCLQSGYQRTMFRSNSLFNPNFLILIKFKQLIIKLLQSFFPGFGIGLYYYNQFV